MVMESRKGVSRDQIMYVFVNGMAVVVAWYVIEGCSSSIIANVY